MDSVNFTPKWKTIRNLKLKLNSILTLYKYIQLVCWTLFEYWFFFFFAFLVTNYNIFNCTIYNSFDKYLKTEFFKNSKFKENFVIAQNCIKIDIFDHFGLLNQITILINMNKNIWIIFSKPFSQFFIYIQYFEYI